jgi:hypothetical protein
LKPNVKSSKAMLPRPSRRARGSRIGVINE